MTVIDRLCTASGSNSGIGKATALGLARLGATVVMVCRDLERGRSTLAEIIGETGSRSVDLMVCDLSSQ
jgi:NAD(P)-dependent dehydrogenase (short-subunit alcohol dehydrogenase family)